MWVYQYLCKVWRFVLGFACLVDFCFVLLGLLIEKEKIVIVEVGIGSEEISGAGNIGKIQMEFVGIKQIIKKLSSRFSQISRI